MKIAETYLTEIQHLGLAVAIQAAKDGASKVETRDLLSDFGWCRPAACEMAFHLADEAHRRVVAHTLLTEAA